MRITIIYDNYSGKRGLKADWGFSALICPCHCTQYKEELKNRFPANYIECGAGLELEL
jgi:metal-dependent hydrolase (beta-lactamase superfamily II)